MPRNPMPAVRAMAVATVLMACAVEAQQSPAMRVHVKLPAYRQAVAIDTIMFVTDHEASAAALWAAAARVFYDYKISTDLRASLGGVVGTSTYVKSSFMMNFPM